MAKGNAVRRNFPGTIRNCPRCGSTMVVTEQMCKRGNYTCGPCLSKASVTWAKHNREKKRAANNAWQAKNSGNRADKTRRYRANNPEKRLAHQKVQTALRNGSLVRGNCELCGMGSAHAHHDDYSKPLVVNWLCHTHHMERHAMLAERARGDAS